MELEQSFIALIEQSIKTNWYLNALTDYKGITLQYRDVARKIEKIHILLENAGIEKGDKIAICGRNSAHWTVTYLAVITYGAVVVPILHEFKADQVHNIVNHSEARLLFVGDQIWENLNEAAMPHLEGIIELKDFGVPVSRSEKLAYARDHLNEIFGHKFPCRFRPDDISYEKEKSTLNKALAQMEDTIDTQKYTNFDTYSQLSDALYTGKVDVIVVGEQYKSMLEVNHEGFDDETRIVKTYEFEKKAKAVTTAVTDVTEKPFTIYITGIDTYGSVSTVSRTDVNLLVTVNPKTKQILMTSIPRDCQINLHKNGKMDKLTHTGIYGVEETISTIEDFLDLKINYYARTNFAGITNIIDALGGVTVDSDREFTTLHGNYHIVKGKQEMDGDKALCFVRERKSFAAGDFVRGQHQQALLKAMLEKAMSPKIITNFQNILSAIEGCFETNMSSKEIKSLINMQLDDNAEWELFNVQIDGDGYTTEDTYSMHGAACYVMKPYQSKVNRIKKLIDRVEEGDKLSKKDVKGLDGGE